MRQIRPHPRVYGGPALIGDVADDTVLIGEVARPHAVAVPLDWTSCLSEAFNRVSCPCRRLEQDDGQGDVAFGSLL